MKKVAIIGATGFVGQKLCEYILERQLFEVVAVSRNPLPDRFDKYPHYSWKSVDLHNLLSIEEVLEGVQIAVYLVHSMLPSARLNQGSFQDFDLSLADNFGRAARFRGVEQIIYMGGLIPEKKDLSPHLKSRLEVEEVLRSYISKTTSIRAGLVLGEKGSSFTIMYRLARRLPYMICPKWTMRESNPVFIDDVVRAICWCVAKEECFGKVYDVGMKEKITYVDMIVKTAATISRRPRLVVLPIFTPTLSRLWVSLVSGAPKSLVYPLIQSLRDDMLVRESHRLEIPNSKFKDFDETLAIVQKRLSDQTRSSVPYAFKKSKSPRKQKTVRSIQRLPVPKGKDAAYLAKTYMEWLPAFLPWMLKTKVEDGRVEMILRGLNITLLILQLSSKRSKPDRQLFYIRGGVLSSGSNVRGRLELRLTLNGSVAIAAIHDFVPSLPWFIYRFTQAKAHAWVMDRFARYLRKQV